jgi:hypothetical protein
MSTQSKFLPKFLILRTNRPYTSPSCIQDSVFFNNFRILQYFLKILIYPYFHHFAPSHADSKDSSVKKGYLSSLSLESLLPDTIGYSGRHSVLGFSVAKGGQVKKLTSIYRLSPLVTNWSVYRSRELLQVPPWTFDYRLSTFMTSYQLNQEYVFNLKAANDEKTYISRYRIRLLRIQAIGCLMIEYHFPFLVLQTGLGAGPVYLNWSDSNQVTGNKFELSWGPLVSVWIPINPEFHLKLAYEVFSVTQNQPIGTSAYFVNSYQFTSVSLGWVFRS